MKIKFYEEYNSKQWDEFIKKSYNGTFLHTRKFLSYHKDRFIDKSIIIYDDKDNIVAVFPAAISTTNIAEIVSHPGITYGGIITDKLYGMSIIDVLEKICKFYYSQGFEILTYKTVPHIYHTKYSQDDLYALFRLNAERKRCDLSATIKLNENFKIRKSTKINAKKAEKNNIQIVRGREYISEYWQVLEYNLKKTYDTKPVHTLEEITDLFDRFEENLECVVAIKDNEVVAGIIVFNINKVSHIQYTSNKYKDKKDGVLELLFLREIENARLNGMEYFDFGTSNEKEGRYLNKSLYEFKKGFNSGGVVYETYEIDLREVNING